MQDIEAETTFDLTTWLTEVHDRRNVRLSARENGDWSEMEEFVESATTDYELDPDPEETVRYDFRIDGDQGMVEKWSRYTFTEAGSKFVKGDPDDGTEIVLEIRASAVDDPLPWHGMETVTFSTDGDVYAGGGEGFKPINAKRVAGLTEEKKRLDRFLETGREEWGLTEETGILLEGPPGTGKTELVMEICQEKYGSMPVMISGPEFLSKWVGESEKLLRQKFNEAKDTPHKVIYIDEIDAITRDRSEILEDYSARIVSQLLVLMDGVKAKQESEEGRSLKIIASTNIPHIVDDALKRPGRLGARPVQFERPGRLARKAILHHYLEQIYTSERGKLGDQLRKYVTGEDLDVLDDVVDKTEGFTGANLEDLVQETVTRVRDQGRDRLDLEVLGRTYEDSFSSYNELLSVELAEADLGPSDGIDVSPRTRIAELTDPERDESDALDVSKAYFDGVADESEREFEYTFRTTSPKMILEEDLDRSKNNVIEAFDHSENERLCLYLKDAEKLAYTREHSSLVEDLIGVLNEQLLQWEDENLLILDSLPGSERDRLTNVEPYTVT